MAADRSNSRRKISRILLIKGTLDIVGLILCKDLREQSHAFQVMATIIYQNEAYKISLAAMKAIVMSFQTYYVVSCKFFKSSFDDNLTN